MKFKLAFTCLGVIFLTAFACNPFISSPSATVKNFAAHLRDEKPEAAANLLSAKAINQMGGKERTVETFRGLISSIKSLGRVPYEFSFEIEEETIISDTAAVKTKFITPGGSIGKQTYRLVKEDGQWKLDDPF